MQTLKKKIEETKKEIKKGNIIQISAEQIERLERHVKYLQKGLNSRCGRYVI